MAISRLIRLPNLLIVGLTQVLLGHILYERLFFQALDRLEFSLLILTTVFIAASGYVINDIYDRPIDEVNKPEKIVIGRQLSERFAWNLYGGICILGFMIASYLAYVIDNFWQLIIYPLAILMLWAYAKFLKKSFLAGNIVVAAYCAFVPGILWYAERMAFYSLSENEPSQALFIRNIFIIYALMAFLTTVWREIIKDMEDLTGDKAFGSKSLPVKYGMSLAQKIATAFGVVILGLIGYYLVQLIGDGVWAQVGYLLIPFGIALSAVLWTLKSYQTKDLHRVSQSIKLLMVFGLGYLFFLV